MLVPVAAQVARRRRGRASAGGSPSGGACRAVLVVARLGDLLQNVAAQRRAARRPRAQGRPHRDPEPADLGPRALPRVRDRSRGSSTPLAVAVLDLDHFKQFNDSHGHLKGDLVLKETAAAWSDLLQGPGILARYGGEEFTVLLPDMVAVQAVTVLDPMRRAVTHGQTCSIGVATWDGRESPAELRRPRRPRALPRQAVRAEPDRGRRRPRDRRWSTRPSRAATHGSLRSVYQPIVNLRIGRDRRPRGAEQVRRRAGPGGLRARGAQRHAGALERPRSVVALGGLVRRRPTSR